MAVSGKASQNQWADEDAPVPASGIALSDTRSFSVVGAGGESGSREASNGGGEAEEIVWPGAAPQNSEVDIAGAVAGDAKASPLVALAVRKLQEESGRQDIEALFGELLSPNPTICAVHLNCEDAKNDPNPHKSATAEPEYDFL